VATSLPSLNGLEISLLTCGREVAVATSLPSLNRLEICLLTCGREVAVATSLPSLSQNCSPKTKYKEPLFLNLYSSLVNLDLFD